MSEKKTRPYKHPQINLRIPEALKEKIQELANKHGRSMNAEIIYALENYLSGETYDYLNKLDEIESEVKSRLEELYKFRENFILTHIHEEK